MKASCIQSLLEDSYGEFRAAAKSIDDQFQYSYLIAGKNIVITFGSAALYSILSPAIKHLKTTFTSTKPDLNIRIFDSQSYPAITPTIPKELRELGYQQETVTKSLPIFYFSSEGYSLAYQTRDGVSQVNFFDKQNSEAILWIRDIDETLATTSEALASPFRIIFAWYFGLYDKVILHSAGVGTTDGGVLFIGAGGSGKTSSALSCLSSGLKFAGDDSILVDVSAEPQAFSLYSSARLFPSDLRFFDLFSEAIQPFDSKPNEKVRLSLADNCSEMLISSFPIKAIIAPKINENQRSPLLETINPAEALRILAPSSLLHAPGQNQETFHLLAKIVNLIPCYRLTMGNRVEIGAKVTDLLCELALKRTVDSKNG